MTTAQAELPAAPASKFVTIIEHNDDVAQVSDDLGHTSLLPVSEYPPEWRWRRGDRLPVVPVSEQYVSFNSSLLVLSLLEGLVPEVREGIVSVMGIARSPGKRTKIAVATSDENIDPVSCCVGRGAGRIMKLGELCGGERFDVIAWHPDQSTYALNALAPARIDRLEIAEDGTAVGYAPRHLMAAAVGQAGLNSSLAGQLAGVAISIKHS